MTSGRSTELVGGGSEGQEEEKRRREGDVREREKEARRSEGGRDSEIPEPPLLLLSLLSYPFVFLAF
jgi:hypothetical protein